MSCKAIIATLVLAMPAAARTYYEYTSGDVSGCGKDHDFNGTTKLRRLTSSNIERSYFIHLPSSYDANSPCPTILGFHNSGNDGISFETDTRLSDPYYSARNIVVYPNGLEGQWAGTNYSTISLTQDLQFVVDVLADIRSTFCVDSARIFATGMGAGGGFANSIACNDTVGGEFAAFAPASGSFYTHTSSSLENCSPARVPMPIIEIHGGSDTKVPYDGGQGPGGSLPPIRDWVQQWADRNECGEPTHQDINDGKVHYDSWTCRDEYGAVQHFLNDEQGHEWASSSDSDTLIEATAVITDFFLSFTRPEK